MRAAVLACLLLVVAACGREEQAPPAVAASPQAPTRPHGVAGPQVEPTDASEAIGEALAQAAWARVQWPGGNVIEAHRLDRLDQPVHAGSIFKLVAARAALDQVEAVADLRVVCPRRVETHGRRVDCVHADLGRPLSLEDALAYSCNHFFVRLSNRLERQRLAETMRRLSGHDVQGFGEAPLPLVVLGLEGPRLPMREWLRIAHAALVPPVGAVRLRRAAARATSEGSASALDDHATLTLAKTGTTMAAGGQQEGMVVAWRPELAEAVVVRVAGGAGRDAARVARAIWDRAAAAHEPVVRVGRLREAGDERSPTRVDDVPLHEYVAGVVAAEGEAGLPRAALQALAVLARSYGLAPDGRHAGEGFDVCDTTHCQVVGAGTAWSRAAADLTRGLVLTSGGRVAAVPYSASCSGVLVDAADVWGGAAAVATHVGVDPAHHPVDTWVSDVTADDLAAVLRASGHGGDVLRDVRVLSRGPAGMPDRIALDGLAPDEIEATRFRHVVGRGIGWHVLKSHAWDVGRTARGYRFSGRGKGHGAGLCVRGAGVLAARGLSARAVLATYVPGARLVSSGDEVRVRVPAAMIAAAGRLREEARGMLADLRTTLAVTAPRAVDLRVHPTREAYQRATGRAWWTSASTRALNPGQYRIDMAPPPVRAARIDDLLPALRHELVHVLTHAALADAPAWAAEGLALAVARPARFGMSSAAPDPPSAAGSCPTDREVTRPGGAEAMRDAYERAATCVKQLTPAGIGQWRELARQFRSPEILQF